MLELIIATSLHKLCNGVASNDARMIASQLKNIAMITHVDPETLAQEFMNLRMEYSQLKNAFAQDVIKANENRSI